MSSIHDTPLSGAYFTQSSFYFDLYLQILKRKSGLVFGLGQYRPPLTVAENLRGKYATMDGVLHGGELIGWQFLQYETLFMADPDGRGGGYHRSDRYDNKILAGNSWHDGFPTKEFNYPSDDDLMGSIYSENNYKKGDDTILVTFDGDHVPSSGQWISWHTGLDVFNVVIPIIGSEFVRIKSDGKEVWRVFFSKQFGNDGLNVDVPRGTKGARVGFKTIYETAVYTVGPRVTENHRSGATSFTIQDSPLNIGQALRFEGDNENYIVKTIDELNTDLDDGPLTWQFTIDRALVNKVDAEDYVMFGTTRIGFRRATPLETFDLSVIPKGMQENEILRYTPFGLTLKGTWGAFYQLKNEKLVRAPEGTQLATIRWRYGVARIGDYVGPWIAEDMIRALNMCHTTSLSAGPTLGFLVTGRVHGHITHLHKDHPELDTSDDIPEDDPDTEADESIYSGLGAFATEFDQIITEGYHSFEIPKDNVFHYHVDLYHREFGLDGPVPQFHAVHVGGGSGPPGKHIWKTKQVSAGAPGFQEPDIIYNDDRHLAVVIDWFFERI